MMFYIKKKIHIFKVKNKNWHIESGKMRMKDSAIYWERLTIHNNKLIVQTVESSKAKYSYADNLTRGILEGILLIEEYEIGLINFKKYIKKKIIKKGINQDLMLLTEVIFNENNLLIDSISSVVENNTKDIQGYTICSRVRHQSASGMKIITEDGSLFIQKPNEPKKILLEYDASCDKLFFSGYFRPFINKEGTIALCSFYPKFRLFKKTEKCSIVEINLTTGLITKYDLCGSDAQLSPDGNYILFKANFEDHYEVYDKQTKKKYVLPDSEFAQWIEENN